MKWGFLVSVVAFSAVFLSALAQTITTTDALGQTIVEIVTLNPAGLPTTQIIQTVQAAPTPPATPTTIPQGQQGPVGQPPHTSGPAPPTVYQYTTTNAAGDPVVVQDTFTPTYVASLAPSAPASGTILDYSQWLSAIGTNTPVASAASLRSHSSPGWLALVSALLSCVAGGAYLVFL